MKLRIEKVIYGGSGLARMPTQQSDAAREKAGEAAQNNQAGPGGKTVFIPGTLPGELVEAHLTGDRRGYSTAELDAVLEPSNERIVPGCEYFPACGGCQMQQASAAAQVQMKLDMLRETLTRAHLPAMGTIGSHYAQPWAYRNRIRLQVAPGPGLALGYRERGSHAHQPVTHCPIAAPILEQAIAAVLEIGEQTDLINLCDEIEFFTNGEQDTLLISLRTAPLVSGERRSAYSSLHQGRELQRSLEGFAEQLRPALPALAGAGLFRSGERSDRLVAHWGKRSLIYKVCGRAYRVSFGSFFQVNRFLIAELLELTVGNRSGQLAWDLYSGAGLFAQALDFENVTAVESSPFSVADLKHNLAGTGQRVVHSSTIDFLRSQIRGGLQARPDLILLDPPRAGLGEDVCACLARIAAPSIVYVSCDPATLSRDLHTLLQFAYRLESIHLVDLFPQTFHLETVAVLARV